MQRARGWWSARLALAMGTICFSAALLSQPARKQQVGPLPDGAFLLNSGWRLQPAGRQVPLDALPMAAALTRDGKFALALNAGYRPPSISVIEIASARVVSTTPVPDAWLGLTFAPNTDRVYVGGGSQAAVFEYTFSGGALTRGRTFAIVPEGKRTAADFIGDVTFSPDGRFLYAADLYRNSVVIINPQSGAVLARYKTGRRPYRILFHPDGKSFFVSHWADGSVGHYDAATGAQLSNVRLRSHPTDMLWRAGGPPEGSQGTPPYAARLFVAVSNSNSVYEIGVTAAKELNVLGSINTALAPEQPLGMTPSALALSADGKQMVVACSDANVAAVVDISGARGAVMGFIPTGWYPTAVRALPNGGLLVLNGKGGRSYPNPPETGKQPEAAIRMQTGTASIIDSFNEVQLLRWTETALSNSGYNELQPASPASLPSIEHVIYIVKETRSYDEVLGDMKEGAGNAAAARFGEEVTPNHHKLAREFALFDNFYVNGDSLADGLNWSTAAIAPDYAQKLGPNSLAGRRKAFDFEEEDPASIPPANYLWTGAVSAGISMRNFGHAAQNRPNAPRGGEQIASVRDPVLAKVTNRLYRAPGAGYPDVERAKTFLTELADFERTGGMPRLTLIRLGNTEPGTAASASSVADNDYAFGMIVEAISKSRFWPACAIFAVEAGAHDGPDHVDSHRAPAFVISPFVKRRVVNSSMYNTASMLRTIELLLGLRPMTHFDGGARVMTAAFQRQPDLAPYAAEKPRVSLEEKRSK